MSFDWTKYSELAQQLCNLITNFDSEAAKRTAVSRYYSAGFCRSRNYAKGGGLTLSGSVGDHGKVRDYFRRKNRRHISEMIERLRTWRNMCDYDDDVENLDVILENSQRELEQLFRALG